MHPTAPDSDPIIENIVSESIAICASLKKYVIAQIGARLEWLERDAAIDGPASAALRKTILNAAVWDFPFLEGVDWDAERVARRCHCNQMQQRNTTRKTPPEVEINTAMTMGADSSVSVCAAVSGHIDDVMVVPLPITITVPSAARITKTGQEKKSNKRARDDPDEPFSSPPKTPVKRHRKKAYTFEDRLTQCWAFKMDKGHLRVPLPGTLLESVPPAEENRDAEGSGFGKWAHSMRVEYHKYFNGGLDGMSRKGNTCNKLEMLEEMGFVFEAGECTVVEGGDTALPTTLLAATDAETQRVASLAIAPQAEVNGGVGLGANPTWRALSNISYDSSATQQGATLWKGPLWEWRLEQCSQFKAENGHLNMMGQWAERMRGLYKRRLEGTGKKSSSSLDQQLTSGEQEKLKALESLDFAFDGSFDVNMRRLEAFKVSEGHCRVPIKKVGPDTKLSNWVAMVRREHAALERGEKSEYLNVNRMQRLSSIGFIFRGCKRQLPWEENFEKLKAYKEEHGGLPPLSHYELGSWMGRMRLNYNNKMDGKTNHRLSDEREEKLRGLGFVFRAGPRPDAQALALTRAGKRKTWDDRLREFVRWKEEHGHPYVPTVTDTDDKHLGRWVAGQRQAYKAYQARQEAGGIVDREKRIGKYGVLTADRALKLANAGFAFDASHIHKTPKDGGHAGVQADVDVAAEYTEEDRSVENNREEERALFSEWNRP